MNAPVFPNLHCKDVDDLVVLAYIAKGNRCMFPPVLSDGTRIENSIWEAFPTAATENLVRAKIRRLIKRGLVDGCCCGCRGDLELEEKGDQLLQDAMDAFLSEKEKA